MDFFHSIVHLLAGVSDRLESMPFSSSEPSFINCGCRFYTFLRVNATFLLLSRLQLTHGAEVEECSASVRSPGTQPDPRKYTILEEYHGEVEITVRFFNGATTNFRVPQSTLVNVVLEMAVEHFALRDPRSMLVHGTVWLHPMATLQELAICTGHILILTWR